jgi:hypothetical protein
VRKCLFARLVNQLMEEIQEKYVMMFPGTDVNIDIWVLLEEMFSKVLYMRCNSFNLCIHLEVAEPFLCLLGRFGQPRTSAFDFALECCGDNYSIANQDKQY